MILIFICHLNFDHLFIPGVVSRLLDITYFHWKLEFSKLQATYSPLKKLEYTLSIVSIINLNTKVIDKQTIDGKLIISKQRIGERTFISVFIYLLVKFNIVNIEIEIDYIWSLLQPNVSFMKLTILV